MQTSHAVVEDLTVDACRQLLRENSFGRLGVIVGGKPWILPVNYVFEADAVVVRSAPGIKLSGAGFGPAVFEIDGVDADQREGWSVLVSGISTEISDALDYRSGRLRALNLQPWVPGEHPHWIALRAESITGRRLTR